MDAGIVGILLWLQCGRDVRLCVELSDVSEVIIDSVSRLCCLDGVISPQEFVVVKGDSNRSINSYYILKLSNWRTSMLMLSCPTCLDMDLSNFEFICGG